MSDDTFLILRVPSESASTEEGPLGAAPEDAYKVETASLSPADERDVRRDPAVRAVARPVPLKLIAPVAEAEAFPGIDPTVGSTWGVYVTGALDSPFSGQGVTVAVLDTGIDAAHAAFQGVELIQRDFTGEGDGDRHGHGTHVAGTIFGRGPVGQRIGVAPGVQRALIGKVLGEETGATTEQLVGAIQWAIDGGAQIINMSLGIDFPGLVSMLVDRGYPADLAASQALAEFRDTMRFFDRAAALWRVPGGRLPGALIVAAAGNESQRNVHPNYTIDVSLPAATDGMVSVAALATAGPPHTLLTIAPFSNVRAMVAGPGVGVYSARAGGGYTTMSGTSMASPHVAGVAALWAERQLRDDGFVTAASLAARLEGTASRERLGDLRAYDIGEGLVVAPQS